MEGTIMNYVKSSNTFGGLLKGLAVIVIIIGFFAGMIAGSNEGGIFFLYMIISLITGLFLASFGEIITLLQTSCDKQHEILMYLKGDDTSSPSAPASEIHEDTVAPESQDNSTPTDIPKISSIEFPYRPEDTLICPKCRMMQSSSHDVCSHCGVPFIFLSETSKKS